MIVLVSLRHKVHDRRENHFMFKSRTARRGSALVAALAAVTLAAGCGGSGAADDKAPAKAAEATPVAEATLKTALLAATDLPAGFKIDTTPNKDSAPITGDCAELANDGEPAEFTEKASVSLAKETETGFQGVEHVVASGTTEGITTAVQRLRDSIDKCDAFTQDQGGTELKVTVTPDAAPKLGDEAVAATLTMDAGGVTLTMKLLVVREGNVVTSLAVGGMPEDPAVTEAATSKAVEKLQKI
jgi:hypothetical protein